MKPKPDDAPDRQPDAASAWRAVEWSMDGLIEALSDLDEAGGIDAAAEAGSWSFRQYAGRVGAMGRLRRKLSDEIEQLRRLLPGHTGEDRADTPDEWPDTSS